MHKHLFANATHIIAPGVYDAFTAHLAVQAGFETLNMADVSVYDGGERVPEDGR